MSMAKNTFIVNVAKLPKSITFFYSEKQLREIDGVVFTRNNVIYPTVQIFLNGKTYNYSWKYISAKKMSMWVEIPEIEKGINNKQAKSFIVNLCKLPKQISENYSHNDVTTMLEVHFVAGEIPTITVIFSNNEIETWEFKENNNGNPDFPRNWQLTSSF